MRWFLSIILAVSLYATEEEFLRSIRSEGFANETIKYNFYGNEYEIAVVRNPGRELLWSEEFSSPFTAPLIVVGKLPWSLSSRLKDISYEVRGEVSDAIIELDAYPAAGLNRLAPTHVPNSIVDAERDEAIKEVFTSNVFASKVFLYALDGHYYRVRVIHNPEWRKFTVNKQYNIDGVQRLLGVTWNCRYGIFVDRVAPKALVDHIAALSNTSYWDWYINFDISNGTKVTYERDTYNFTYTYYLDTWYVFSTDFK